MFVKICGITNIRDAYAAAEAGADAIGLNFYPSSKRFVSFDEAAAIVREVSPYVKTAAVMVRPTIDEIAEVIDSTEVDAVQVYEPKFDVRDFNFPKSLYYSVRVKSAKEVQAASKLGADLIFLDAYRDDAFGGTGQLADWSEISASEVDLSTRFVVSGGLTPENVCDAIKKLNPCGVDTASGVEVTPREKNHERIRLFVSNAKICK